MTREVRSHGDVFGRPEEVRGLRGSWTAARDGALFYCPDYRDFISPKPGRDADRHVVAVAEGTGGAVLFMPFTRDSHPHVFNLGERRLGRIAAKTLRLGNPWLTDAHDPQTIADLLGRVLARERADLIDLGDVREGSSLRAALDLLPFPALPLRLGRKEGVRWLIDLPACFDDYLHGFPRKERRNLSWKLRRVRKEFDMEVRVVSRPEDVEPFLREGERISRMTYQWGVGQRLCNDRPTREWFVHLAEQGRLRCHLLLLDGVPCAFSRGVISGGIYLDDTPGFDPQFARYSVGTVLMLHVLMDLIANTSCRVFDFGTGGDWAGYKARFGTRAIPCNAYYVLNGLRPRALSILSGERLLSAVKNAGATLLRDEATRMRIKRRLRRYGA